MERFVKVALSIRNLSLEVGMHHMVTALNRGQGWIHLSESLLRTTYGKRDNVLDQWRIHPSDYLTRTTWKTWQHFRPRSNSPKWILSENDIWKMLQCSRPRSNSSKWIPVDNNIWKAPQRSRSWSNSPKQILVGNNIWKALQRSRPRSISPRESLPKRGIQRTLCLSKPFVGFTYSGLRTKCTNGVDKTSAWQKN